MKKVLLMFAFIATLLVGSIGTAGAQVNYTVYDGTGTSSQVPVYGLYCDAYLKCEYVIPADHLTAINGSTISALKFYSSAASTEWEGVNFRVFLKEVASTTISAYSGYADATQVYMGALSISGNEMVVNFTTNYTYNGGNLLIGFYNETIGDYAGASFYGQTIQNSCVQGYSYSSLSGVTTNQRNFIPKTTFTVDELHGCLTPTNLAVSDITPYGATVTWTPGNTETDWVVKFNDDEYPVSGTPSYTVTGLTPETDYVASVKAVCGDTEESEYTTPGVLFTTLPTCPAPTGVTVSNITSTSADVAWTENVPASAWTIDYNGTEIPADSNPFTLTGLTPATNYTVKVKANCAADDESDWSAIATFATACDALTLTETESYSEDFDSYTATSQNTANGVIPTCWGTISNGTNANTHPRVCTSYVPSSGSNGLNFRSGGSTYQNCGTINIAYLPEFTNPQGAVVSFAYRMENASHGTLFVGYVTDIDDVNSFVSSESVTSSTTASNAEIIIPATIPAGARIALKWEDNSTSFYDCGIDNIVVNMAPTCPKPTGITVSNITPHTADIAWTENGTASEWTILLDSTEIPTTDNPFTLTGLTSETSYTISVKTHCTIDDESDWSNATSFTTAISCPRPTAVSVSNITTNSADISWTNGGSENAWIIDLNGTEIPADNNPFLLTGLSNSTEYTVKVKAVCGEGDESQWSTATNFATECGTFMVTETTPYTQGFESTTFPPTCWSRNHTAGTSTNTWIRTTSSTYVHQGTGAAQLQDQQTDNRNDLVTGLLNIPEANTYQVDFWMYRSTYSSLKPNEGVKVWVNTTPDTVGATEIMYIHREYTLAPAEPATGWYEYSAVIPTSGDMYVIFQGISEYGAASYIDDITVNKAPTCLKPIDVTVSNITETTAEISWTEQGTTNEWTIMLDSTEIPATTNPFTLTGLNPSTRYTVKVKAVCSEDDESDWSNEVSFRTECAAVALPFYESFEDGEFGCWTVEEDNTSYTWHVVSSLSSGYTGGMADGQYAAAMTCSTSSTQYTAKLISPVLDLSTTMFPALTFSYLNALWSPDQNVLSVYYRTDANAEWTLLETYNSNVTSWTEETISLPNPTATYQIAFEGETHYGRNIHVDAISVEGTSCPAPTNVVVANETENSAEVSWTAGGEETAWNLRYRTAPETVVAYDFENDLQGWSTLNTDGDTLVFVHSSENISGYLYDSLGHNGSNGFAVSNSYIDDMGEVNVNQYFVVDSSYTANETTSFVFYYDYGNDNFPDYFEAGVFTQDPTDATNFTSLWNSSSRGAANAANANVRHTERTRYENWREVAIDLSEFAGQQVWIAFHHQDYDNYELWIDDISIVETAEWTVVNGVTNPYTITDLTANTTYEVQVQAACSDEETSNWTASVEFTTLGETPVVDTCEVPANIAVEHNVVTWESEAENFNLMYVVANDTTTVEVAGNTYTFEGLEDGTVVTVMVQAICDEDNTSDWSEATEFTFEGVGIHNYGLNANVYPNPTRDVVNVECSAIGANLSVYDMFGKVVMNTTVQSERTELNLSNVAPGVYVIRIANSNAITTVKVVKE